MSPQNGASPLDFFRHVRDIDNEGEGLRVHVPVENLRVQTHLGLNVHVGGVPRIGQPPKHSFGLSFEDLTE